MTQLANQLRIAKIALMQSMNLELADDFENAFKQYEASKKQLAFSKKNFDNAQYAFLEGLMSTTEFVIEKNNYFNAESVLVSAKYQYLFSRMILDFHQGKPLGFM